VRIYSRIYALLSILGITRAPFSTQLTVNAPPTTFSLSRSLTLTLALSVNSSANELALRHRSILRKLRAADSEHDLDNSAASGAAAGAQSKSVKSRQLAERWIQRSLTGVILRMHTLESFAERQTHTDSGTTNRLAALPSAADVGPRSRIFDTSARVEYSTKGAGGGGLEAQQQAQELATHFDVLYDNGEFESHVERDRVRSLADLHRDELERGWQTRAGFV